jgi:hypothetical protein
LDQIGVAGDFHLDGKSPQVCDANIQRLREAIDRGPEKHPGACRSAVPGVVADDFLVIEIEA